MKTIMFALVTLVSFESMAFEMTGIAVSPAVHVWGGCIFPDEALAEADAQEKANQYCHNQHAPAQEVAVRQGSFVYSYECRGNFRDTRPTLQGVTMATAEFRCIY